MLEHLDPSLVKMQFQVAAITSGYKAQDYFRKFPAVLFPRTSRTIVLQIIQSKWLWVPALLTGKTFLLLLKRVD
jgi:hypothetical protein